MPNQSPLKPPKRIKSEADHLGLSPGKGAYMDDSVAGQIGAAIRRSGHVGKDEPDDVEAGEDLGDDGGWRVGRPAQHAEEHVEDGGGLGDVQQHPPMAVVVVQADELVPGLRRSKVDQRCQQGAPRPYLE